MTSRTRLENTGLHDHHAASGTNENQDSSSKRAITVGHLQGPEDTDMDDRSL